MKNVVLVILCVLFLFVGLPIFFGSWFTVNSGEVAIVTTWGAATSVVEDGLHLKWPIAQSVIKVDVKTRKAHSPSDAGSKDLQRVSTNTAINYHLDRNKIKEIYSKTGLNVEDNIIEPRIQEVVKAVVARYSADQLLAKRDVVKGEIEDALKSSLTPYFIVVEAVQITNFDFSKEFNATIEAKQMAEQNAQKAKNDLTRIQVEAEQRVTIAKAEAEAIKIQSEAVQTQGGKAYISIKAIEKWDGKLPTYFGGSGPLPFLDVAK